MRAFLSIMLLLVSAGLWAWSGQWRNFAAPTLFAIIIFINVLASRRRP